MEQVDCRVAAGALGVTLRQIDEVRVFNLFALAKGLGGKAAQEELQTCYGHVVDARIWRYIGWIPRYVELFRLSREARQVVHQVKVPTVVFMAGRDEQVSLRSETCMAGNPCITLRRMPRSSHHLFTPEDKAAVTAALLDMCQ